MKIAVTPEDVFGKINPSDPSVGGDKLGFLKFGQGAAGISNFLDALIRVIYIFAALVFVFMIIWSAFEWLTAGGDKEKVAAARSRLTNAFIGIILFGIAFAILNTVGVFTGFQFFK